MRVTPKTILELMPMAGDIESPSLQLNQDFGYSIQAAWEGTPEGVFHVEVSNDQDVWTEIENSAVTVAAEEGHVVWNMSATPNYAWARLVYTYIAGAGLLTVKIFIRGF